MVFFVDILLCQTTLGVLWVYTRKAKKLLLVLDFLLYLLIDRIGKKIRVVVLTYSLFQKKKISKYQIKINSK